MLESSSNIKKTYATLLIVLRKRRVVAGNEVEGCCLELKGFCLFG